MSKTRRQYPVGSSWFPGWGSLEDLEIRGMKAFLPHSYYDSYKLFQRVFFCSPLLAFYLSFLFISSFALTLFQKQRAHKGKLRFLAGRNKLFPTVFLASVPYSVASFLSKTWIWPYHSSESPIGHISNSIVWLRRLFLVFNLQYSKYAHQDKSQWTVYFSCVGVSISMPTQIWYLGLTT